MNSDIGRFGTAPAPRGTEAPAEKPAEEQRPPELVYGSAEEFLHEQLLPTYVRDVDGRAAKWCIEWYFHPEVGKKGITGIDIEQLRNKNHATVHGAGDSHFRDPEFVKAAREKHEARLLAEGGSLTVAIGRERFPSHIPPKRNTPGRVRTTSGVLHRRRPST